jgi:diguanylate cyclase (GGDEF)-like protein
MPDPSDRPPVRPESRRLHAIVGGTVLLGVSAVLVAWFLPGGRPGVPAILPTLLTVVLVAVSDTAVMHLRYGRENYTLTWSEAAIVVGLVLTPWPWVTIACPVGMIVAQAFARRDPMKIAFNAASIAVEAVLACVCVFVIAGSDDVERAGNVRFGVALAVAAVAVFAWNTLSVSAVIATVRGLPVRVVVREGLALKAGLLAGNTVVALLLVYASWRGSAVVLIPFCIVLLYLSYRAYHGALEDSEVWRQLDAAVKEFTRLDAAGVAASAVSRAVSLFKVEFAELALSHESLDTARVFRHHSDGTSSEGHELPLPDDRGADQRAIVDVMLSVPIGGLPTTVGVLRLGLHDNLPLPARHQRVLGTFARGVAVSLQNARLYSEMRYQADRSAYEATRDTLTGIANRRVLHNRAEQALAAAAGTGGTVGLLLIDLDHFKEINDTLGHHAGDMVLCKVAERLDRRTAEHDLLARLGGDEFAILLSDIDGAAAAELIAEEMLRAVNQPVDYEGLDLAVGGSIGVAVYPEDGLTAEDLLRRADMAMYQAKTARGSVARYRSDRDDHTVSRITLAAELRDAIADRQFLLHFQPQVDLVTYRVIGAEALARWNHPTRGLLGPVEFIDLVERSGLTREFASTVLEQAIAEATVWHAEGLDLPVSVNLSARNLLDPELPGEVESILARFGLPAELLVLELTETTMITDAEATEAVLGRLRRIGVKLSVDDFGTGYSSLAFLQRVAVNEIKIDKTFVMAMTRCDSDAAIVRATIELAHGLGIRVVAEGVETPAHVAALQAFGCDVAQGWHFGRPGSSDQIREAAREVVGPVRRPVGRNGHRVALGARSSHRSVVPVPETELVEPPRAG